MITTEKEIKITRGDSFGFNFEITDENDQQVELDACYFSCKEKPSDTDCLFQKSIGSGITKLNDGGYYVKIDPADTDGLESKKYYYDLEATIGNDVYTFLKGKLNIGWDVTRESEES